MARKTASRMSKRKEAEAAEAQESGGRKKKAAKKKVTRKKTTKRSRRSSSKIEERKQLLWGVFSASMKEEARFPYDQRNAAEQKIEQLRAKSKKLYFIQPIKVPLPEAPPSTEETAEQGTKAKK